MTFSEYKQLEEAYVKEEVYPLDLKNSVADQLNKVSIDLPTMLLSYEVSTLFF